MKRLALSLVALSTVSAFGVDWKSSEWISVKEAPVCDVFDVYVNGARIGNDFLKPGTYEVRR